MTLLTGCVTPVLSGRTNIICSEPMPTFSQSEIDMLSDQTINEVDNYFARVKEVCNA